MEENQVHIPDGWKLNELGNLIKEQKKSSLKVSDAANFGKFPFFTSGEAILKHTSKQLDGKNIFLATGGVANIKYFEGEAAYSTDTYAVTTKDEIDADYLYFDLLNILYYINANYFQGSGLKHLQKKDLKRHQILFPGSPYEQTTIASILSKVDEAIAQTEQLIAKYTRIKTGLMQDLLTKGIDEHCNIRSEQTHEFKDSPLGRIPKEWQVDTLGDIILSGNGFIQTGPFGSQLHANEYVIEGIPVIMPQDIKEYGLNFSNIVKISQEKANSLKRHIVQENDIIFARRGDLSKCSYISISFKGSICGTGCLLIRLNKAALNPYWLELIYKHHSSQKEIDITAVGTTMKNLNPINSLD
ncbi:MAG: restriction endonuclease subunit S [Paludibacter sp.]|nr:restriction endonuclease subunit S [Paludibacter sp.]MDD4429468.1 restriction endonuclease subunit S [Paludibacter sp.]